MILKPKYIRSLRLIYICFYIHYIRIKIVLNWLETLYVSHYILTSFALICGFKAIFLSFIPFFYVYVAKTSIIILLSIYQFHNVVQYKKNIFITNIVKYYIKIYICKRLKNIFSIKIMISLSKIFSSELLDHWNLGYIPHVRAYICVS